MQALRNVYEYGKCSSRAVPIEVIYKIIPFSFMHLFYELNLYFKSPCFEHEQEVRAILRINNNHEEAVTQQFKVEHLTKKGYIIPYITILFPNKECLKQITIGPLSERAISQETAKSLLLQRGYNIDNVKIINSDIPIRF